MNKEKFDVIFSMHEPPSSHLCALRIKSTLKRFLGFYIGVILGLGSIKRGYWLYKKIHRR